MYIKMSKVFELKNSKIPKIKNDVLERLINNSVKTGRVRINESGEYNQEDIERNVFGIFTRVHYGNPMEFGS